VKVSDNTVTHRVRVRSGTVPFGTELGVANDGRLLVEGGFAGGLPSIGEPAMET
jgi:hypothetical protein